METQTYDACRKQIGRIGRALYSLDNLIVIDRDFAGGKMSYKEAIENLIALSENQGTRIPITIKPEVKINIPISS